MIYWGSCPTGRLWNWWKQGLEGSRVCSFQLCSLRSSLLHLLAFQPHNSWEINQKLTKRHPSLCKRRSMSETSTVLIQWGSIVLLSCFSALFSGLTLGLLSLDKIGLKIVMSGGDEHLAALATTIAPVRENGNLLLCTLLLGNVSVNSALSILMADMSNGMH